MLYTTKMKQCKTRESAENINHAIALAELLMKPERMKILQYSSSQIFANSIPLD